MKVTREVDGGLETVSFTLPGIMKARKKELKEIPVADLGVDVKPKVKIVKMEPPPKRQAGKKVESVEQLVELLHSEAKVI